MVKRTDCQLQWVKSSTVSSPPEELDIHSRKLFQTIQKTGLPTFKEAASPEEEAIWLLEVAAEIEHGLLVEYLYSAYSIESDNGNFQQTLTEVAIQEMGHLITVQNLLLAIGGNVYFERQDESPQASLDPFPFTLEPLSKSALGKYVLAEMPLIDDLPDEEQAEIEQIRKEHQFDEMQINRVGALYLKLYWLFQSGDEPEDPWKLPKDIIPADQLGKHITSLDSAAASMDYQTDSSEWRASVTGLQIDLVGNRADALNAIYRISAQGEGFAGPVDSHFERFRELYRQYDGAQLTIRDVPTDPFTSKTPDAKINQDNHEPNRISHPVARVLVELADVRYEKMLLHFAQFFAYSKTGSQSNLRRDLIEWSLGEMQKGIRTLSLAVKDLPRTQTNIPGSPTKAALLFTIPNGIFPTSNNEQWQLLTQLLDQSQDLKSELDDLAGDFSMNPGIDISVSRVLSDDEDKREIIAAQITNETDSPIA
ncbi:MAG: ferritin-like domain-containing protein [Calothrix sp. MO_167.B42]|nr:ferritin-like domain-containing protein [Calothrix sp. MO_167.B42]